VLPLLALLAVALRAHGAGRRTGALLPVALLLAIGVSGKVAALTVVDWDLGVVRSLWGLADLLAIGMLTAVVSVEVEDGRLSLPRRWRGGAAAVVLAIAGLGLVLGTTQMTPRAPGSLAYTSAVGVACALVVALVTMPGRRPGGVVRVLELRALGAAGVVSYSAFLWHEPLLRWLRMNDMTAGTAQGFLLNVALTALVTAVAATLTYRFVELPALRLRDRSLRRRPASRAPAPPRNAPAPARNVPA
jgi:peptidoglycan/LPS O-acetylase OafA/YrhL